MAGKNWTEHYKDVMKKALAASEPLQALKAQQTELEEKAQGLRVKEATIRVRIGEVEAEGEKSVTDLIDDPSAKVVDKTAELKQLKQAQSILLAQIEGVVQEIANCGKRVEGPVRKVFHEVWIKEQGELDLIQKELLDRLGAYEHAMQAAIREAGVEREIGNFYGSSAAHLNCNLVKLQAPHRDEPLRFDKAVLKPQDPRQISQSTPDPQFVTDVSRVDYPEVQGDTQGE